MTENFRVIPKIDIKEKNVVKGIMMEGLRVLGKPEDFVKFYYENGADEIILHDIMASLYGVNTIYDTISFSSSFSFIPMCVGGGIRSLDDMKTVLRNGADKVAINSAAITNPLIINQASKLYGTSTIVISIECLESENEFIATIENARNKTNLNVLDWAKEAEDRGAGEIILTLVKSDGTGKGCNLNFLEKLRKVINIPIIINGGLGNIGHLEEIINIGLNGAAISSMFHYKAIETISFRKDYSEGNLDFLQKNENYLDNIALYTPNELKKLLLKKFKNIRI